MNPATGSGWTADKANLADSSCGSVILDRVAPTVTAQANDTTPGTGDLVTFERLQRRRGLRRPRSLHLGLRRQHADQAGHQHHPHLHQPRHLPRRAQRQRWSRQSGHSSVDIVVTTVGNTGDDGVIIKPPDDEDIGEDGGTQRTNVGSLKVIAPKQHKLAKKAKPSSWP